MHIDEEQFDEWKSHPVTKEIFAEIIIMRQKLLDSFSDGNTLGQRADTTHGLTNKLVGQIDGLNQLLNITFNHDDE